MTLSSKLRQTYRKQTCGKLEPKLLALFLTKELKSKEKLLNFYCNEITKLKISLQEKEAEIVKRKSSYDDLVARLEEEVKEKNALKTAR